KLTISLSDATVWNLLHSRGRIMHLFTPPVCARVRQSLAPAFLVRVPERRFPSTRSQSLSHTLSSSSSPSSPPHTHVSVSFWLTNLGCPVSNHNLLLACV